MLHWLLISLYIKVQIFSNVFKKKLIIQRNLVFLILITQVPLKTPTRDQLENQF